MTLFRQYWGLQKNKRAGTSGSFVLTAVLLTQFYVAYSQCLKNAYYPGVSTPEQYLHIKTLYHLDIRAAGWPCRCTGQSGGSAEYSSFSVSAS